MPFREILREQVFESYEEAQRFASFAALGNARVAGLDPRQSAFPLEALSSFERLHDIRTVGQQRRISRGSGFIRCEPAPGER
jgi:hypothetical protein